jgi:NSS family neurotransmitter:Na+ symporter
VDIVDFFLNHYGLVVSCLLETVLVAWIFKAERLRGHINAVGTAALGVWWRHVVTYWVPLILAVLLAWDVYANINSVYGGYKWYEVVLIGPGWIAGTLLLAYALYSMRWKRVVDDK